METIKATQKKYGSRSMFVAIVVAMALIVIGEKAAGKGLVLGALFSVVNFIIIGQTIPQTLGHGKRVSIFISLISIMFRYALLAVPLIVAIKFDQFSLTTAIIGIFTVQLMILWDQLHLSIRQKRATS